VDEIQGVGVIRLDADKLDEFKRLSRLLGEPSADLLAMLAGSAVRTFSPFLSV
jgi:hypothetical protein